jgi:hypothetical protein
MAVSLRTVQRGNEPFAGQSRYSSFQRRGKSLPPMICNRGHESAYAEENHTNACSLHLQERFFSSCMVSHRFLFCFRQNVLSIHSDTLQVKAHNTILYHVEAEQNMNKTEIKLTASSISDKHSAKSV